MSSCLRMALAFSTATSSAKLKSSVGDLVLRSCSFISCMHCYSKRGMVEYLKVATRSFGMWVFRGRGICLGREAGLKPDPRRFDPIFQGFFGPRQRSRIGCDSSYSRPNGRAEQSYRPCSKWPHNHQNHDANHEQRRNFVYHAVETRIVRVAILREVLGPFGEHAVKG